MSRATCRSSAATGRCKAHPARRPRLLAGRDLGFDGRQRVGVEVVGDECGAQCRPRSRPAARWCRGRSRCARGCRARRAPATGADGSSSRAAAHDRRRLGHAQVILRAVIGADRARAAIAEARVCMSSRGPATSIASSHAPPASSRLLARRRCSARTTSVSASSSTMSPSRNVASVRRRRGSASSTRPRRGRTARAPAPTRHGLFQPSSELALDAGDCETSCDGRCGRVAQQPSRPCSIEDTEVLPREELYVISSAATRRRSARDVLTADAQSQREIRVGGAG